MDSENKKQELRRAIRRTVAFFDLFDFPLTAFETWKYLGVKRGLDEVQDILREMNELEEKYGFYFLPGRSGIVETRMARYNAADHKFRRAIRVARIFKFIPWVRMIAVGNIIGGNNLKNESDIDFFIVTAQKRIWLTRFFCAGFAKLFGLRPTREHKQDKICLSFYAAEDGLDTRSLMIGTGAYGAEKDIYFLHWFAGLTPVYDAGGVYDKLIAANAWLAGVFPNWRPVVPTRWREVGPLKASIYRELIDLFLGGLERAAKKFQLKIMPAALKSIMNKDTRVVVNDRVLKLYTRDRREEFRTKYFSRLEKIKTDP